MRERPEGGKRSLLIATLTLFLVLAVVPAAAAGDSRGTLVGYYFTGEGCPHCARVNPVLFGEWLGTYPHLVVVEYEVYGHRENAMAMAEMDRSYGIGLRIPVLFFGPKAL
jgi:glutaredoxin